MYFLQTSVYILLLKTAENKESNTFLRYTSVYILKHCFVSFSLRMIYDEFHTTGEIVETL